MTASEYKWYEYFLDQIPLTAAKSKDPSTKVGAIITGPDYGDRVRGFNGFARGVNENPEEVPERWERPEKYEWIVHAEDNAILYAARHGIALNGCYLFVDWHPCHTCADSIVQAGIAKVIIDGDSEGYNNQVLQERWKIKKERAEIKLKDGGVEVIVFKRKKE